MEFNSNVKKTIYFVKDKLSPLGKPYILYPIKMKLHHIRIRTTEIDFTFYQTSQAVNLMFL